MLAGILSRNQWMRIPRRLNGLRESAKDQAL
jgi:hypothetical protein